MQSVTLFNSLSKRKETFVPYNPQNVSLYCCGFTVYDHTHIGHIKKYIGDDLIRRVLEFNGYKVTHVQNVTDVGHLVSDSDEGEDKLEKGAKKYGLDPIKLARKFEREFYKTMKEVNNLKPSIVERAASDKSIDDQIANIQRLLHNGFAYTTEKGVYFDVSKLPEYNPFSAQPLKDKLHGSREGLTIDPDKKNPTDFALWVFAKGIHEKHIMRWNSPWGIGFPGWHIECSSISMSNLGENIDIHTGGIDHLEIHHPNEIAQNFGITGHDVVKYWLHHNFLVVDGVKMSKSLNNFYTLQDVRNKIFNAIDIRYLVLQTHYRQQMNFTWEALESAKQSLNNMVEEIYKHYVTIDKKSIHFDDKNPYYVQFMAAINDDFNVPMALGTVWELIRDKTVSPSISIGLIFEFDKVLGLNLKEKILQLSKVGKKSTVIPLKVKKLVQEREKAREEKNWEKSDLLREQIIKEGFSVEDTPDNQVLQEIT